jgi:hypothetical protein
MEKSIEEVIIANLIKLDNVFANKSIPISERPQLAFHHIYSLSMEIPEKIEKNELMMPIFVKIYPIIHDWYHERYGENIFNPDNTILSCMLILGIPYKIIIPTSMKIPHENSKDLFYVYFPKDIQEFENIFCYLENNHIIKSLSITDKENIGDYLKQKILKLRTIYHTLRTFNGDKVSLKNCKEILKHHNIAVEEIVKNQGNGESLAIWELFFSCELMIKEYLRIENISFEKVHDIRKLVKLLSNKEIENNEFISQFPDYKKCIDYRYGTSRISDLNEINRLYNLALDFIYEISKLFPGSDISGLQRLTMKNIFQ